METLNCGSYAVNLFVDEDSRDIVYTLMDDEDAAEVWLLLKSPKPTLAAISGIDWNRELSPWSVSEVFRGGGDFGGEGSAFLGTLTEQIVPLVEERLGFTPKNRAITGYSLAGLFALWSVFNTDVFDRVASVSGSLWFDGFLDYMKSAAPSSGLIQVYLSLGDREKSTRNQRMAVVEDCTCQTAELLRGWDIPIIFEMNPGGHFQDVSDRIARGINKLMESVQ